MKRLITFRRIKEICCNYSEASYYTCEWNNKKCTAKTCPVWNKLPEGICGKDITKLNKLAWEKFQDKIASPITQEDRDKCNQQLLDWRYSPEGMAWVRDHIEKGEG